MPDGGSIARCSMVAIGWLAAGRLSDRERGRRKRIRHNRSADRAVRGRRPDRRDRARRCARSCRRSSASSSYVENVPGAGGNTGVAQVATAAPRRLHGVVRVSRLHRQPSMYAKVPYDSDKDFAPVTLVGASPNVLIGQPIAQAQDVKELVDLIKANPGKYSFAQPGTGSTPHLSGELFKPDIQARLRHVPLQRRGPAIQSALGGHTPIAVHGAAAGRSPDQGRQAAGSGRDGNQANLRVPQCADPRGNRHQGPGGGNDAGPVRPGRARRRRSSTSFSARSR